MKYEVYMTMLVCILVASMLTSIQGGLIEDKMDSVIELSEKNFHTIVKLEEPLLAVFYAPWCGFCKKISPIWEGIAREVKKQKKLEHVIIAKINCVKEKGLCDKQNIKGFPTIQLYKDEEPIKFSGQRSVGGFLTFLNKNIPAINLNIPAEEGQQQQQQQQQQEGPEAVIPGVVEVTKENFLQINESDVPTLVEFYAPWCGFCKRLAPVWKDLGRLIIDQKIDTLQVMKVNCINVPDVCKNFGIQGYPSIKYFSGFKIDDYRGKRELKNFVDFLNDKGHQIKLNQKPRLPQPNNGLYDLDNENFRLAIYHQTKVVLVEYYAPWCGFCKRLEPIYKQLAEHYAQQRDVIIARINCDEAPTAREDQNIKGFPTLKLYKAGKLQDTFQGDRSLEGLKAFVEKYRSEHNKNPSPTPIASTIKREDTSKLEKTIEDLRIEVQRLKLLVSQQNTATTANTNILNSIHHIVKDMKESKRQHHDL